MSGCFAAGPRYSRRWVTAAEVSFSEHGERGSIDVLAGHPDTRSLLVIEVKASLGSLEDESALDVRNALRPARDGSIRLATKDCLDATGAA